MLTVLRILGIVVVCMAAVSGSATADAPAHADLIWGANGHPFTAYRGIALTQQLDILKGAGLSSYRVDITDASQLPKLTKLVAEGKTRGIDILPVITPAFDLDKGSPKQLYRSAFDLAVALVTPLKDSVRIWELGNEMENYAIIKACEVRDDGSRYSCLWGDASGNDRLSYAGTRWAKVSAVLKGLSDGTISVDPTILKAMGSAGWGHTGAFERMKDDGILWDISIWHMYGEDPEPGFKALSQYGHPIWVTEFNNPYGSQPGEQAQADGLAQAIARLRELSGKYNVQAAHIYEMFNETYWAPSYEAYMGLVNIEPSGADLWRPGKPKLAYARVRQLIAGQASTAAGGAGSVSDLGASAASASVAAVTNPATSSPGGGVQTSQHRNCNREELARVATSPRRQLAYGYCLVLGRSSDGAGLESWLAENSNGMSLPRILLAMIESDEFVSRHDVPEMSNTEYVTLLYRLLLNREPDGAGLTSYVAELDSHELTRSQFAAGLLASDEFKSLQPMFFPQRSLTGDTASRNAASNSSRD